MCTVYARPVLDISSLQLCNLVDSLDQMFQDIADRTWHTDQDPWTRQELKEFQSRATFRRKIGSHVLPIGLK